MHGIWFVTMLVWSGVHSARVKRLRPSIVDPYLPFIEETLRRYPKLEPQDLSQAREYAAWLAQEELASI